LELNGGITTHLPAEIARARNVRIHNAFCCERAFSRVSEALSRCLTGASHEISRGLAIRDGTASRD